MKSPVNKIQFPYSEALIKIEPLVTPEHISVPPLRSQAVVTDSYAVSNFGGTLLPSVRDATSVAASLSAWEDDP